MPWLAVICALVLAGCVRTVAPIPVLGQLAGAFRHGEGFGNVTPSVIYNGGDNTGYVGHVVWKSWGGSRSVGSGVAEYVGPGQYPATGTEEPGTVVAFKLGTCDGKLMYQAIEWYFPQQSQTFNPNQYENICTGTYVTHTTTAGTVRGVLLREPGGGAAPGTLPHPMAGTVLIEFNYLDALKAIIMTVATNGKFSRSVPPGTYKVMPGSNTGCVSAPITAHVRAGEVVTVKVKCGSSIG